MVNVVNPQSLPDPTGLNAAAGVLSALGPFRDMSGIKELGSFLQTLSNNATQLAAEGLKGAQAAGKINTVRGAKEVPASRRTELIDDVLKGLTTPSPAPATSPATDTSTGAGPKPAPTPSPKLSS